MLNKNFFSLSIKQPINQWLCIGLMCAWCLWVVVHYVQTQATTIVANQAETNAMILGQAHQVNQ